MKNKNPISSNLTDIFKYHAQKYPEELFLFKKQGITAALYETTINGSDDTTHLIEFYYPDAAS